MKVSSIIIGITATALVLCGCDNQKSHIKKLVEAELINNLTNSSTGLNIPKGFANTVTPEANVTITAVSGLDFTGTGTITLKFPDLYTSYNYLEDVDPNSSKSLQQEYRNQYNLTKSNAINFDEQFINKIHSVIATNIFPASIITQRKGYAITLNFPSINGRLSGNTVSITTDQPTVDLGTNQALLSQKNIMPLSMISNPIIYNDKSAITTKYNNLFKAELAKSKSQQVLDDRKRALADQEKSYVGNYISADDNFNKVQDDNNTDLIFKLILNDDLSCSGQIKKVLASSSQSQRKIEIVDFVGNWSVSGNGISINASISEWKEKNILSSRDAASQSISVTNKKTKNNNFLITLVSLTIPAHDSLNQTMTFNHLLRVLQIPTLSSLDGTSIDLLLINLIRSSKQVVSASPSIAGNQTNQSISPSNSLGVQSPKIIAPGAAVDANNPADNVNISPQNSQSNVTPGSTVLDQFSGASSNNTLSTDHLASIPANDQSSTSNSINPSAPQGVVIDQKSSNVFVTDPTANSTPASDLIPSQTASSGVLGQTVSNNPEFVTQDAPSQSVQSVNQMGDFAAPDQAANPGLQNGNRTTDFFPQTRLRVMSSQEISQLNPAKIKYAVNEMFARYGYVFKNGSIQNQFMKFEWYKPNPSISELEIFQHFSKIENSNFDSLLSYIKSLHGYTTANPRNVDAREENNGVQRHTKIRFFGPKDKFPPDVVGSGVIGSLIPTMEGVQGGEIFVASGDQFNPFCRQFLVVNRTSGLSSGAAIPLEQQVPINFTKNHPLIIQAKGPLPGCYTVRAE